MSVSFRHLYQEAFPAHFATRLHFAAHSHHPWPDVTLAAHTQYWKDSVRLLDQKWSYLYQNIFPTTQRNIARAIGLLDAEQIAIAPNTHGFVVRLLSCFPSDKPLRILTTDSEFFSFARQARRTAESENVSVERISVQPFATFQTRFVEAARTGRYDLVFFSHVFFNSGLVVKNLDQIVDACPSSTKAIVIDGYHAFFAIPIQLSNRVQSRAFYLGGGYKYAQSGEGVCFLAVPPACELRPANTGWFAEFSELESGRADGPVQYAKGGARFAGATFDPSGCYRLNAVCEMYEEENLSIEKVHEYVMELRGEFLRRWRAQKPFGLSDEAVMNPDESSHFITFCTPDAGKINAMLLERNVQTDVRFDRLRFGFGLYQDHKMLEELFICIKGS